VVDGTRGICTAHLFLAEDLRQAAAPTTGDMEELELLFMSSAAIQSAVREGNITLLPDIALLSMVFGGLLCGTGPGAFFSGVIDSFPGTRLLPTTTVPDSGDIYG
jgi:hypothetical protein